MSEHKATVKWARNGVDFGYETYPRDHVWLFNNGIELPASAAPAYLGDPNRVDPESAFVAALSSCHMLTFLALASNEAFVVDSYEDHAFGFVEKNASGKLAVTRVESAPKDYLQRRFPKLTKSDPTLLNVPAAKVARETISSLKRKRTWL